MPELNLPLKPVGEVIGPLEIMELPEDHISVDAIIVVKTLNQEGKVSWHTRYTEPIHSVEALGALRAAAVLIEKDIEYMYRDED